MTEPFFIGTSLDSGIHRSDGVGARFYPLHRLGFSLSVGRHLPVAFANIVSYDVGPDQRLDEPADPAFARDR